jgi:NAD(P)-dependent dehydrogenase (short-subunit alcohol dehydrogenase family)
LDARGSASPSSRDEWARSKRASRSSDAQASRLRPFPADLTDIDGIPALVRAIEEKLGRIDVALYAPVTADVHFVPAVELDARKLDAISRLLTLAPVEVAHSPLPGMLARGAGALVFASGLTAVHARPGMRRRSRDGGHAPLHLLAQRRDLLKGVYAGHITLGAMIERPAGLGLVTQSGMKIDPSRPVPTGERNDCK